MEKINNGRENVLRKHAEKLYARRHPEGCEGGRAALSWYESGFEAGQSDLYRILCQKFLTFLLRSVKLKMSNKFDIFAKGADLWKMWRWFFLGFFC